MILDFDEKKSMLNKSKHGIDFIEAQALWLDNRVEVPARGTDELRHLIIGRIGELCWSAVITHRENAIRIISVRRSRSEEVALYESP